MKPQTLTLTFIFRIYFFQNFQIKTHGKHQQQKKKKRKKRTLCRKMEVGFKANLGFHRNNRPQAFSGFQQLEGLIDFLERKLVCNILIHLNLL